MPRFDDSSTVGTGATSDSSDHMQDLCSDYTALADVPASELLGKASKLVSYRASVERLSGWPALPKFAQVLIVLGSVLLVASAVFGALWYTVLRDIFFPWTADLTGEFNGSFVHHTYPCILDESVCSYSFDSQSPVKIKFNGTENLTDSNGHALKSPWVWRSGHDVEVRSLSANETLRVNNDPSRSFQIVAHQRHVPAPSHPSPSKPAPSHPSPSQKPTPSPSKPPSPAPMMQPPYCEIYLDGRLFAVHVTSMPMALTDLATNSSDLNRVDYPPFGVFDPHQSVVDVDCYEGANYSLNGGRPVVNGTFSPSYELLNFSFGNGVGANRSNWLYQFSNFTNAMATVIFNIVYKGEPSQETVEVGWQNLHMANFHALIRNSTLSINGASPESMVSCYRGSTFLGYSRNVAVTVVGDNDEFVCTITAPSSSPLPYTFNSPLSPPSGVSPPFCGDVCSVFNGELLVSSVDSRDIAPYPDPFANPSAIYILPDSNVKIGCSQGVSCTFSPSPSPLAVVSSTDCSDLSPKKQFSHSIGKEPLSLSCQGYYGQMNYDVVTYARVAGFYWYSGPNPSYSEWMNLSSVIYDGDNGEKNVVQVTWNTQVGAKFVGDVYAMCSQDGSNFFQGNSVVFNASGEGTYTKCQLMSRTNFASASLWFKSVAPPNATSTSASKAGLFSASGKNRSVVAENFANAMVP